MAKKSMVAREVKRRRGILRRVDKETAVHSLADPGVTFVDLAYQDAHFVRL